MFPSRWVAEEWLCVANSSLNSLLNFYNCAYQHFVLHQQSRKTDRFLWSLHYLLNSLIIPIRFLLGLHNFNWPYCRNTPAPEKLRPAGQWCWEYVSFINICPAVNTCQLKFQPSAIDIFIVIVPYYIHYFVFVMVQAHDSSKKKHIVARCRDLTNRPSNCEWCACAKSSK